MLIPCAKDTIYLVNYKDLNAGGDEPKTCMYKLSGFQLQTRIVYSPVLENFLIKCNTKEDPCCKFLAFGAFRINFVFRQAVGIGL